MKAKLTRRILATLLVLAMILTLVPAAFASSFSDVPAGAWYDEAVTYCEDNGIMSGVGGGKFNPSGKVPREQGVQALYALDGSQAVPFEALFSDVKDGQWFAPAVTWGAKNSIVAGVSTDKFGVGQNVTREQMAAFFFRYANYVKADTSAEGDLSVFPDKDDTSAYAVSAIKWAVGEGIISGVKQNDGSVLLKPKDPLTRAQLAVMMMKFHQLINAGPEKDLEGKTVILHSNDVHGAIEGYAFIAAQKADFEARGAEVILADAGDYSQGTTNVSLSKGANAVDLMNLVGYDVATLGNHEFDYGADQMFDNLSKAEFAVTCADVLKDGEAIFDPYVIIEKGGVKIAFIGLETPEAQTKANPALIQGLTFLSNDTDPAIWDETQKQIDAAKAAGADIVVGLVHLGVDGESMPYRSVDMLQEVTGFDFVIDGHSHTVMENGPQGEPIQSTGTAFANIGCIVIDNATKAIEDNYLIPTEGLDKDEEVAAAAQEIIDAIAEEYGAKFATSEVDLNGDKAPNGNRDSETNNGDFITDAMIWSVTEQNPGSITGVPAENIVAITNGGGIRAWIHKGDVTKNDIFTVLPFGNTVAVVYVTGAELLEALEASTYCTPEAVGGFPQIAGMNITINIDKAYDANAETYPGSTYYGPASINRVTIDDINGQPFDPTATYAVVTNNFCAAGGDTYYAFAAASSQFDTGRPLDEVVMDYVTEKLEGVIPASLYEEPQGRITLVTEPPIPAGPIADGDEIAIVLNDGNKAITTEEYLYEAKGYWQLVPAEVTVEDGTVAYADGITFTVVDAGDGYFMFMANGEYLTSGETGNNLTMEPEASDLACWTLVEADGGYYLQNKAAQYNGNPQFLEYYTNFTVYGMSATANPANYTFSFYPVAEKSEKELEGKTVILHTNDVHGAIAGYANIAALKAEYEAKGAEVILADAGDYSQGTTYVSLSKGANAIDMMNLVGYDVATLGNHEFDYGAAQLFANLEKAEFAVTCADILKDGEAIYDPYVIIEKGGVKVAFIGLETPEAQTKANPALIQGLTFLTNETDPTLWAETQKQVDAAKAAGADIVVALAHLGVDAGSMPYRSVELYENVEGLDFIIDGHSHTVMVNGPQGEPIQSTGNAFANVGVIVIDNETKAIEDNYLVAIGEGAPADPEVTAAAQAIILAVEAEYGEVFATSEVDLNGDKAPNGNRDSETNNGDLITDAMIWYVTEKNPGSITEVPAENIVAITNGGGIRAWIAKGDVTKNDILTVLPFGNTATVVYVTGAELLEALEASTFCTPASLGGFPQVAGIEFTLDLNYDYDANAETYPGSTYYGPASINRVTIDSINGQPFDPDAKYAVVTNDFCAGGGDTYYAFAAASSQFDTGFTLDAIVMEYITEKLGGVIPAALYEEPQGRITIIPKKDVPEWDRTVIIGGTTLNVWFTKYGNTYCDCTEAHFTGTDDNGFGFKEGDIVTVSFLGQSIDLPVGTNYSDVDSGTAMIKINAGGYIEFAINMGNFGSTYGLVDIVKDPETGNYSITPKEGVTFPVEITFELKEAGGYAAELAMHRLNRTNNREDYADLTDEEFANFRQITTTGMGDHLYRGSSPINPEIGRNTYADAAIEDAGVTVIMNLADSEDIAKGYEGFDDSYYAGQNVIFLNLGVDFTADDFKAGLAEGLRFFAENEGTYYVHCSEGKDRAGFVSALLECLMGATAEEVVADYMVTYYNYYGVTTDDERYEPIAKSNIIKTLCTAFGIDDLYDEDLGYLAAEYIKGLGLSDEEIAALKANLGNKEADEKTFPEYGDLVVVYNAASGTIIGFDEDTDLDESTYEYTYWGYSTEAAEVDGKTLKADYYNAGIWYFIDNEDGTFSLLDEYYYDQYEYEYFLCAADGECYSYYFGDDACFTPEKVDGGYLFKCVDGTYLAVVDGTVFPMDYVEGDARFVFQFAEFVDFDEEDNIVCELLGGEEPIIPDPPVVLEYAIVLNDGNKAISTEAYLYESKGYWQLKPVAVTVNNGTVDYAENIAFAMDDAGDGYVYFIAGGKYLTSGETGNNLTLEDEPSDLACWLLVEAEGGYYIQNKAAQYNGNPQFLEFYTNFTVYGMSATANPANYTFSLIPLVAPCAHDWVAGTVVEATCTEAGYTEYTCSLCGATKNDDEIAALGHNYVEGICSRCGDEEYIPPEGGAFVKVTSAADLEDGQYLIVYETDSIAMNGGLEKVDAGHNIIEVVIEDGAIAADETTLAAAFTFEAMDGGWSILAGNGKYISGSASANTIKESAAAAANTITIDGDGNATIFAGGYLMFNKTSGDTNYRFRYYKAQTQQPIQLYKLAD